VLRFVHLGGGALPPYAGKLSVIEVYKSAKDLALLAVRGFLQQASTKVNIERPGANTVGITHGVLICSVLSSRPSDNTLRFRLQKNRPYRVDSIRRGTTPEAMKQTFSRIPQSRIALETGTHPPW
jgi:hypothetical protein